MVCKKMEELAKEFKQLYKDYRRGDWDGEDTINYMVDLEELIISHLEKSEVLNKEQLGYKK